MTNLTSLSSPQTTYFNQRPTRENFQFEGRNTIKAPQDPALGDYNGIKLPDFGKKNTKEVREYLTTELAADYEVLSRYMDPDSVSKMKGSALFRSLDFKNFSLNNLLNEYSSRNTNPVVNTATGTVRKPVEEFLHLLRARSIREPIIDLNDPEISKSGRTLMAAVRMLYSRSGLPRMPKAYGISDFLAKELGSLGSYEPENPELVQPNVCYKSRTSIPVTTRMAWNRITREALLVKRPFIPANMRCVTDVVSARLAIDAGLCPVVSYTAKNANLRIEAAEEFKDKAFITVRTEKNELAVARQILAKGGNVCIELANAHMATFKPFIATLKKEFPNSYIMAGNAGSPEAYWYAVACGADVVKLGRGPGAGCTTPEETGISPGQISLAYEVALVQAYLLFFYGLDVPHVLDGGLSTPGHCLIAGLLGSETMMMGSKYAVAKGSPASRYVQTSGNFLTNSIMRLFGRSPKETVFIEYFGEASEKAAMLDGVTFRATPQGKNGFLPEGGTIEEVSALLEGGLRGAVADSMERSFSDFVGNTRSSQRLIGKTAGSERETATRLKHDKYDLKSEGRF